MTLSTEKHNIFFLVSILKSQSIISQSCPDGSSWVEPVLKCLAQGHNIVTQSAMWPVLKCLAQGHNIVTLLAVWLGLATI